MTIVQRSTLFTLVGLVLLGGMLASPLAVAEQKNVSNKKSMSSPLKFNRYAYIFLGPGLNAKKDRAEIKTPDFTFKTVGIAFQDKEQVIEVAKQLVAEGAQMIELCGGFGPIWVAKVSAAINNKVPVGSVAYGPEARKPLVDLLSDVNKK